MEEVDTRDRIAQQCRQEALAVQDMLTPRAAPGSQLERIVERIRMALRSKGSAPVKEFPATPSPATILFDPAAAGPPFDDWHQDQPEAHSSPWIRSPIPFRRVPSG